MPQNPNIFQKYECLGANSFCDFFYNKPEMIALRLDNECLQKNKKKTLLEIFMEKNNEDLFDEGFRSQYVAKFDEVQFNSRMTTAIMMALERDQITTAQLLIKFVLSKKRTTAIYNQMVALMYHVLQYDS